MTSVAWLMSTYSGTDPDELSESLQSICSQTRPADDIVLVQDGPVAPEVRRILAEFESRNSTARIVVLEENQGSGPARAAGLQAITSDFVAVLDSDDIATPERLEKQLQAFEQDPSLDIVGTAMAEFSTSTSSILGVRKMPETHLEITRYARINSPVNNPSVMMRTSAVKAVGSYRSVHHLEDYDLFARLLAAGYRFHNLSAPLTYFRVSPEQFKRRTGKGMFRSERQMQHNLVRYGLVSRPRALLNLTVRTAYRSLPSSVLKTVYSWLFRV